MQNKHINAIGSKVQTTYKAHLSPEVSQKLFYHKVPLYISRKKKIGE